MKYTENTCSYNDRRYGKPWIAKIDFDSSSKANFNFGNWIGEIGQEGILEIEIEQGDVIAIGQKDLRKPANSAPRFHLVTLVDGEISLTRVSKKEAYLHYKNKQDVMPTREELLAKKAELIKQLEFCETMLQKIN